MKIPVIIDCDPGLDDVIALLMALKNKHLDIKAITAVGGNQTLEIVGNNILRFLTYTDIKIPVAFGCSEPLKGELFTAVDVHGEDGLYGISLPENKWEKESIDAIGLMAKTIENSKEKITIIALGPLTNIATLLETHPEVKNNIDRIHFMGGAICGGNLTKASEFNIYVDPEAASIVFNSNVPLTMCGLDVTEKAYLSLEEIKEIKSIDSEMASFVSKVLESLSIYHKDDGLDGCHLHDPVAILSVTNPDLIHTIPMKVEVELEGKLTRGMTVGNFSKRYNKNPNIDVAIDIDRKRFIDILTEEVKKY